MIAVFRKLTLEQQAHLLVQTLSETQPVVTEWVAENLGDDAFHDEVPNFTERVDMLEEAFCPFNAAKAKQMRIDELLSISIDAETWGGNLNEDAGNFVAASAGWDNLAYFIATGYCKIDKNYLNHHFVIDPEILVKENLETFAFRAMMTGLMASELAYYELGLPDSLDFNQVITGWGTYASHANLLSKFEKGPFNMFMMEKVVTTFNVTIEIGDNGTVQLR